MIRVLIPDMPNHVDLLPYLRRMDESRVYVNHGPLVQELEARLEQITGVPCVTVSSGTIALELALQATEENMVYVPALTFSATGLAAQRLGYGVVLFDVNSDTWQLKPGDIRLSDWNRGVVMPVAAFGCPVDIDQWEGFGFEMPVIIDAAGAFPAQSVSKDPNITTCFSLHATKFIGCGEGGFVASNNPELIAKVRDLSMFGEDGTNAKMSEYHAAVALASLDRMGEKHKRTHHVAQWYRDSLDSWADVSCQSTMLNILLPLPAAEVIPKMLAAGIETKQWYRPYLDERTEFGAYQYGRLPVTDHLRTHLLGLPFHNFLTQQDVTHVCDTLRSILK